MEKKSAQKKAMEGARAYCGEKEKKTDPQGSWTGQPKDKNEVPVQDADDL